MTDSSYSLPNVSPVNVSGVASITPDNTRLLQGVSTDVDPADIASWANLTADFLLAFFQTNQEWQGFTLDHVLAHLLTQDAQHLAGVIAAADFRSRDWVITNGLSVLKRLGALRLDETLDNEVDYVFPTATFPTLFKQ